MVFTKKTLVLHVIILSALYVLLIPVCLERHNVRLYVKYVCELITCFGIYYHWKGMVSWDRLKGQCHLIFDFRFSSSVSPKPLIILLGPFRIVSKIHGDICSSRCTTGAFTMFSLDSASCTKLGKKTDTGSLSMKIQAFYTSCYRGPIAKLPRLRKNQVIYFFVITGDST